ncbi:hypothetical protein QTO34_003264 [Cnephaeus nilssonii]|uniref:LRAT domain-containing protein n=1 Tax=Cnephaeus nilssonii TaxID=3371016 RepID=A0AA40HQE9_CNENI|nr:hypothetical protein QTO34_003264 [Eptesicus nilssonii]
MRATYFLLLQTPEGPCPATSSSHALGPQLGVGLEPGLQLPPPAWDALGLLRPNSSGPAQQPQQRRPFPLSEERALFRFLQELIRGSLEATLSSFQSQAEPKPGDLIEISRVGYAHWALYVGDGYVVHLGPPGEITSAALANIMSSGTDRAIVKKELLSEVVGNHWYRVNNKHDQKYAPLPPSQIVQRAEEQLTSANCEHFVNELRYGVPRSDQVTQAALAGGVTVGMAAGVLVLGLGIAAIIRSLRNRDEQEEQKPAALAPNSSGHQEIPDGRSRRAETEVPRSPADAFRFQPTRSRVFFERDKGAGNREKHRWERDISGCLLHASYWGWSLRELNQRPLGSWINTQPLSHTSRPLRLISMELKKPGKILFGDTWPSVNAMKDTVGLCHDSMLVSPPPPPNSR